MSCKEDVDINGQRRRIAIITGANGVLGCKIAQRLLEQIRPEPNPIPKTSEDHEQIRIVLACRSLKKAEGAVTILRKQFLDRTLLLEIEDLDLCCMQNVEDFCKRFLDRGKVIDWLIFNAGVAEVVGFNWFTMFEDTIMDPMRLFTVPRYLIERTGTQTQDGIPLVFQANVFGHYYMLKRLAPLLTESSKVQWSVSLETSMPSIYDPQDPTSQRSHHSYGSSKRFIELLHCYLVTHPHVPMYFLTHPGITDSGVVAPYQFPIREIIQKLKIIAFYVARCCGSPWHSISGWNGACSMIYCALKAGREGEMIKWGSGSDWCGRERLIGTILDEEAEVFEKEAREAFDVIEALYKEWSFKMGVKEEVNSHANGDLKRIN